ncbi:MAG: shikimate dehydrogenase [Pseudomonadota bacterium]|nr:shikimate dehydrogenase [Pseudomonadota bacterium]
MGVSYAEVIGDPVAHSKSPLIHNFWLRRLGIEGEYRATRVTADQLPSYLVRRRGDPDWRGCNVTIPHKQAIMPLLDERKILREKAVNCVVREEGRLIGYNTDTTGIGRALPKSVDTRRPVCIIGAGGAAHAAVAELDIRGVYQFNVIARDPAKAASLVAPYVEYGRTFAFDAAGEAIADCAGLINASPLGMAGFDPMPYAVLESLAKLSRGAFVLDLVYSPVRTALLARAEALGLLVGDGLTILEGQADEAFSLLFGMAPPPSHPAELRELLTS